MLSSDGVREALSLTDSFAETIPVKVEIGRLQNRVNAQTEVIDHLKDLLAEVDLAEKDKMSFASFWTERGPVIKTYTHGIWFSGFNQDYRAYDAVRVALRNKSILSLNEATSAKDGIKHLESLRQGSVPVVSEPSSQSDETDELSRKEWADIYNNR